MAKSMPAEDTSVASLMGRILADTQALLRQEFALARVETRKEILHARTAVVYAAAAAAILVAGGLMVLLTVVRLLELAGVPLWASYGLVAIALIAAGAALAVRARRMLKELDPVPRETVQTMQENIQWLKKQT